MQTILQIIQFEHYVLCSELNCWFRVSQALSLCLNIAHNKDTQKLLGRGLIIATYKPKLILCVRPTTDKMHRLCTQK